MDNTNSLVTIDNVRGYVDQNGTVWLNAEDVARGLGFVMVRKERVTTSGDNYEAVRWARVNEYLSTFGFPQKVGEKDFLPENMFYRLAMKASNATAEKFQAKVADEILPQIRKTGSYSVKPMSLAQQIAMQAQLNLQLEERLGAVEGTLDQQAQRLDQQFADIKRLTEAHNGMSLRHEMRDNEQQQQLDRHEEDIDILKQNMFDLLKDKADITQDLDIFIKDVVNTYDRYQCLGSQTRYRTAWNDFYKAIAEEAGKPNPEGYIMSLVNRQRERQIKGGIAKTTAQKNVTGKTIINSVPELKNAAIAVMTKVMVDIRNHEAEAAASVD